MARVTLGRVEQKIDDMHDTLKEIKVSVSKNTKFRHQAMGAMSMAAMAASVIGGIFTFIATKLWGKLVLGFGVVFPYLLLRSH